MTRPHFLDGSALEIHCGLLVSWSSPEYVNAQTACAGCGLLAANRVINEQDHQETGNDYDS
jgi:hypothetical protein